ncbi:MAG: hypothetical protein WC846_04450 [Candidatus Gracilibacteria bacterium]|jgi:hypothetical protein
MKIKIILSLTLLSVGPLFFVSCESQDDQSEENNNFAIECNVEKQILTAKLESEDGSFVDVSSDVRITAKTTNKLIFTIPEETTDLVEELYQTSNATYSDLIDANQELLEGWEAGKEYTIDLSQTNNGETMRYFICVEEEKGNESGKDYSMPCYPSCYYSRFLVEIEE